MCGFAGYYDLYTSEGQESRCRAMLDAIIHRGPDDEGIWSDDQMGICLGFRRLSILDLSSAGHQPMKSHSGRFVVVFNGEIYNTNDLRQQLESEREGGHSSIAWLGHSDTETLLESVEAWGIQTALKAFKGMFAFALFDRQEKTLTLARDRFGEKPLYWGWNNITFLFGSELKALRRYPRFKGEVELDAMGSFLARGYVPSPQSIFRGIHKLPPGCYLVLPIIGQQIVPEVQAYWSVFEVAKAGKEQPEKLMGEQAVDALDQVMTKAVHRQMLSDVPLGAFLSGGIDSSLIVSIMCRISSKPVQTFSIGFKEWGFNEAGYARDVATRLGTDHEELCITERDAMAVVPDMPGLFDEPFADNSQIPTFLLCKLARKGVTVALSGDGGDEIFGGYNRYFLGVDLWDKSRILPNWLRGGICNLGSAMPARLLEIVLDGTMRTLPKRYRIPQASEKFQKGLQAINAKNLAEVNACLLEKWDTDNLPMMFKGVKALPWPVFEQGINEFSPVETLMLIDAMTYLPDDIMVKVDRAAMANSLETRAPFLDPDVCAFAWGLPLTEKVRNGEGKRVLKALLSRYLPENTFCRPKSGLGLPVSRWLRGPMQGWAEDLLFQPNGALGDFLDMSRVQALWTGHLKGRNNFREPLWSVLMLGGWLEQNRHSCVS